MSKIIGVDYGRRKIGLAIANTESNLASPLKIIRYKSLDEGLKRVAQVVRVEKVDLVVIGISEGKMAGETKEFAKNLEDVLSVPIKFQDETLTTREAQELSIRAGIRRKKRKLMEDAYSATLILQAYLDS